MPLSEDLVCWSHVRWSYGYQRAQQLMLRWARVKRVFFVEEPVIDAAADAAFLEEREDPAGVMVVVPHVPAGFDDDARDAFLRDAYRTLYVEHGIVRPIAWYDAPHAIDVTRHLEAGVVVYDCVREVSSVHERELLSRAHVVFVGGHALYEVKSAWHDNVHVCPSSVDVAHFARARVLEQREGREPDDQARIPRPRIGFHGVVDDRVDIALVEALARMREEWQFVLVGPVARAIPELPNIHVLGPKSYESLPHYLAGFDVALLPFQLNDATRFSSTAKALELMAAGKPIVSTPIPDVVRPYAEIGLVHVARGLREIVGAIEEARRGNVGHRCAVYDAFLESVSWDSTFTRMYELVERAGSDPLQLRLTSGERFFAES